MTGWQPIETAPRDGTDFLALNHDGELWVTKYLGDRIVFRTHKLFEPRRFEVVYVDGETLFREDVEYNSLHEEWRDDWTYWTRGYAFKPTHWCDLPPAPDALRKPTQEAAA